jgi:hypothetical protein
MTRHILSTATLVAFLASGHALLPASELRRDERGSTTTVLTPNRTPVQVLSIAERMLAVSLDRRDTATLAVALQFEGEPVPVRLWTGAKNAWGSTVALAEPAAGLPGFLRAEVVLAPTADRLWIGLERDSRRPAIGSLHLDLRS